LQLPTCLAFLPHVEREVKKGSGGPALHDLPPAGPFFYRIAPQEKPLDVGVMHAQQLYHERLSERQSMARPESTTDPPQLRCPRCDSSRTIPIPDSFFPACQDCGWPLDSVQELHAALLEKTSDTVQSLQKQFIRLAAGVKEQLQAAARAALRTPSHASLPTTPEKPSLQEAPEPTALLESQQNPEAPAARQKPRRHGGRKPNQEREKSLLAVRTVIQKHRDQLMAGQLSNKDVAAELIEDKQDCWHRDGWGGHAAEVLISNEMKALRNS
jgi:hypothetical protein